MSSKIKRFKRKFKRKAYASRYKRKRISLRFEGIFIYCAAILCMVLAALAIKNHFFSEKISKVRISLQSVAAFRIPYKTLSDLKLLSGKYEVDFPRLVTLYSVENDFFPNKTAAPLVTELEQTYIAGYDRLSGKYQESAIENYYELLKGLFDEIQFFPIAYGEEAEAEPSYMYGDNWGDARSYGGERTHLGTDLLDRENIRGRIPIVSMTSGVVENIGWNELGGYRVGIRSKNGNYYYYAHFESYAPNLTKDTAVAAGQLLGYMGDTGYSKKEGATGQFPVHLHVGLAPATKLTKGDFWINPYPFLRYIEGSKVQQPWRNP